MNASIASPIVAIAGFVVVLALMLALVHVLLPLVIRYELAREGIAVRFLGNVVVWTIEYRDVDSVKKVRFPARGVWAVDPTVLRLGNRLIGDGVLVRRKNGLIQKVVITPDCPDEFIASVSARLEQGRQH